MTFFSISFEYTLIEDKNLIKGGQNEEIVYGAKEEPFFMATTSFDHIHEL